MARFVPIREDLSISGVPSPEELKQPAFRSLIDLRAPGEGQGAAKVSRERSAARAADVSYVNIPVSADRVLPRQIDRYRANVERLPKPIRVHCASGKRAGSFAVVDAAIRDGLSGDEAVRCIDERGFSHGGDPVRETYRAYVDDHARSGPTAVRRPQESSVLPVIAGGVMAAAAVLLFVAEKRRPLRTQTQPEPMRPLRNVLMGVMSTAVVSLLQKPIVEPLAEAVEARRWGLAQRLPAPPWLRDGAAFLLMDYTIYVWHVLTHKVPLLWRFHLVHHIDLDMDTTTAMRFHAVDMAVSMPWRAAQVLVCGASPRALLLWQAFFTTSVLFHHSNLRLPLRWERALVRVLTTPRLHGIHHSAVREETDSNWSSGLSLWDWLHGTIRVDVPQDQVTIGVPAYRSTRDIALRPSLALPFVRQRDAWRNADGARAGRDRRVLRPEVILPADGQAGARSGGWMDLGRSE